jgi:tRNA (cmo5U34)-methyltransferase
MRLNGYDRIASKYDRLAKLVFGDTILEAQKHFIPRIKPGAKILIMGGGSGLILPVIFSLNPSAEVYFVDASKAMIDLAKKRIFEGAIHFIHGTEENIPELTYDCVITSFYLDLFREPKLKNVVEIIARRMSSESQWIATDFVCEKPWHKVMLKIMCVFFSINTEIETKKLPDWRNVLNRQKFASKADLHFYNGFILTSLYELNIR